MADKFIVVREGSDPGDVTFVLRDFRSEDGPNERVDITGYVFKLIVKRDLADKDADAFFDLTGAIVTALDGIFKFVLTREHTSFTPATYPAEIRWWKGGAPATAEPPTDSFSVDYTVEQKIRRDEP